MRRPKIAATIAVAAITLAPAGTLTANAAPSAERAFATKAEAEAFLVKALPEVTEANPRYRAPGSDIETRWLTKAITFSPSPDGGVLVAMQEAVLDYRGDGVVREGSHGAAFPIDAVDVAVIAGSGEIVDKLEDAHGVLLKCRSAPCIETDRNGVKSMDAATDISVADSVALARIAAAFRALQRGSGLP
jgi:hypothetical protein